MGVFSNNFISKVSEIDIQRLFRQDLERDQVWEDSDVLGYGEEHDFLGQVGEVLNFELAAGRCFFVEAAEVESLGNELKLVNRNFGFYFELDWHHLVGSDELINKCFKTF